MFASLLLLLLFAPVEGTSVVGGRTSPDGRETLTVDLPGGEHLRNRAGRDGLGLCVFTSVELSGRWQNVPALLGFQQTMTREPGGGWPEKLDAMLDRHAPGVRRVQYVGDDPALLRLVLRTWRMPAVTYGYSPRYGRRVSHMVNLCHLSARWACVLDNNFPGADAYEWMTPDEFLRRWRLGGDGWMVALLDPPPPPLPRNQTNIAQAHIPGGDPNIHGVCRDRFRGRSGGCWIDGRRVTPDEARRALLAADGIDDDSGLLRVTVIGSETACRPVRDDFARHPALAPWRGRLVVQEYRPDHWAVQGIGLTAPGEPRIVVQSAPDPEGRAVVLHAQPDYAGGAEALAGALRAVDPSYEPARDPDRRPRPDPPGDFPWQTVAGGAAAGLCVLLVLLVGAGGIVGLRLLGRLTKQLERAATQTAAGDGHGRRA